METWRPWTYPTTLCPSGSPERAGLTEEKHRLKVGKRKSQSQRTERDEPKYQGSKEKRSERVGCGVQAHQLPEAGWEPEQSAWYENRQSSVL